MAQKGGPCLRGQRLLDKRTLSSCCWPRQRSTTVSEKIRLCSSRVGLTGTPEAPPLGELSPKVTERARMLTVIRRRSDSIALTKSLLIAAWAVLSCRACPLSLAFARQLPQRGSHWQAGSLSTGRLRPDMAQKGGPCLRGQRLLDKRTLSSCCWPRQRSTTVSEKIRLCSSRVGLTGTPEAPPLGELSPKVTERARMLTVI